MISEIERWYFETENIRIVGDKYRHILNIHGAAMKIRNKLLVQLFLILAILHAIRLEGRGYL